MEEKKPKDFMNKVSDIALRSKFSDGLDKANKWVLNKTADIMEAGVKTEKGIEAPSLDFKKNAESVTKKFAVDVLRTTANSDGKSNPVKDVMNNYEKKTLEKVEDARIKFDVAVLNTKEKASKAKEIIAEKSSQIKNNAENYKEKIKQTVEKTKEKFAKNQKENIGKNMNESEKANMASKVTSELNKKNDGNKIASQSAKKEQSKQNIMTM